MTSPGGVVALLFTDLVRSTGLGRALRRRDPAAAREALDEAAAVFEACGATWRRGRAVEARP